VLRDKYRNPELTVKRKDKGRLLKATILNYSRMSLILRPLNLISPIKN